MALPLTKPVKLPLTEERRRHQRVKVNLLGRYMLADRREFPCQVTDMSPGGMALVAPIAGQTGERVIAYVDHLGRLEGKIARVLENGFAMSISATLHKRDKLAAQLTWLANRQILNLPEDRRHDRFAPRNATARDLAERLPPEELEAAFQRIDATWAAWNRPDTSPRNRDSVQRHARMALLAAVALGPPPKKQSAYQREIDGLKLRRREAEANVESIIASLHATLEFIRDQQREPRVVPLRPAL